MMRQTIVLTGTVLLGLGGCTSAETDFHATQISATTYELVLPQDSVNVAWKSSGLPIDSLVFNHAKKLCGKDEYQIDDKGVRKRADAAYPEQVWLIDCLPTGA